MNTKNSKMINTLILENNTGMNTMIFAQRMKKIQKLIRPSLMLKCQKDLNASFKFNKQVMITDATKLMFLMKKKTDLKIQKTQFTRINTKIFAKTRIE